MNPPQVYMCSIAALPLSHSTAMDSLSEPQSVK